MTDVRELADFVINKGVISREEALALPLVNFDELFFHANRIRQHFFGSKVKLCSIVNAKCGACSQDCKFCAQSAHNKSSVIIYPIMAKDQMIDAANEAAQHGINCFSIVTSGETIADKQDELNIIKSATREISKRFGCCVSIGSLTPEEVTGLIAAGVMNVHHNLETSKRFFPEVCTTHTYESRVRTVLSAKAAGANVCSGGLFGLGETWEDRVDLALELRELDVDCAPVNFLNPIAGTPLESRPLLDPIEALKIVAMFRFVLGHREVQVCGGRVQTLRDLQPWVFKAGASGMMTGNYLTTLGRRPEDDIRMIKDLGLTLMLKNRLDRSRFDEPTAGTEARI